MRAVRALTASIALTALAGPGWAHGAEELGHHWDVPAYRTEMQTQILMMAGVSLTVVAVLWLTKVIKTRGSRG